MTRICCLYIHLHSGVPFVKSTLYQPFKITWWTPTVRSINSSSCCHAIWNCCTRQRCWQKMVHVTNLAGALRTLAIHHSAASTKQYLVWFAHSLISAVYFRLDSHCTAARIVNWLIWLAGLDFFESILPWLQQAVRLKPDIHLPRPRIRPGCTWHLQTCNNAEYVWYRHAVISRWNARQFLHWLMLGMWC